MQESVFLALPSKCCDTTFSATGPNPSEFVALLSEMRDAGLEVNCPLEEVGWNPISLPGNARETVAGRLNAIERADHVVAFPRVGQHTSSGVLLLVGIAYAWGRRVTVVLPGKDSLDVEWQLKGLAEFPSKGAQREVRILLYTGSVVHCWPELHERLLGRTSQKTAHSVKPAESNDVPCPFEGMESYWSMRRKLLARWYDASGNEQVRYDEVGLYTVKPEGIAREIAREIRGRRVVDLFAGIGGVSFALARDGKDVVAVEKNPHRYNMLVHNCQVYDVLDRVHCLRQSAFQVLASLDYDAVYLDPPWGGPLYRDRFAFKLRHFDVGDTPRASEELMKALLRELLRAEKEIAFTVPNNFDFPEFTTFLQESLDGEDSKPTYDLRIRWGKLDGRVLFMTLFLSPLKG